MHSEGIKNTGEGIEVGKLVIKEEAQVIFPFFVCVRECVHLAGESEVALLKLYYIYNINNNNEGRRQGFKIGTHAHSHAQLLEVNDGER
jgi:hypothetical protein